MFEKTKGKRGRPRKRASFFSSKTRAFLALGVPLALSITLMQYHSILYWMEKTGNIGIVFSLGLEVFGLYFWWYSVAGSGTIIKALKYKIAAVITTVLLVYGPVLKMMEPLIEKYAGGSINVEQVETLKRTIIIAEQDLKSYQELARKTPRFRLTIDKKESELSELRKKLGKLQEKTDRTITADVTSRAFYEVWVFIMFAVGQVLIIREMRMIGIIPIIKRRYKKRVVKQ